MKSKRIVTTFSILIASILLVGCETLGPKNQFKPVADTMGPDTVLKCFANAQHFNEKGKNENADFGSQYVKPYSNQKWQTAKLMQQFYFNIAQNFTQDTKNKLHRTYSDPRYFTKTVADECQRAFDNAPMNLKNAAFHDSPFFTDPQKTTIVCTATGNSIANLESAVLYFKRGRGVVPPEARRAFGTCAYSTNTRKVRDFIVIHDLGGKDVRWMGSFRSGGQLYFSELTQFDKYYNVSYFPDARN
jgi:hypothetical protein